jgi:hypothetical protein
LLKYKLMAMWLRDFPYPGALLQESAIAASQIPDGDLDFVSWQMADLVPNLDLQTTLW